MDYRNPTFTADGLIDCEINHPGLGRWIPFTVNPADDRAGFDVAALDAAIRAAGGIAPYVPPAISVEALVAEYTALLEDHVDQVAKDRGYRDATSFASYAASTVPQWASEAQTFIAWRDSFWAAALQLMGSMMEDPPDTPLEFPVVLASLPQLEWR